MPEIHFRVREVIESYQDTFPPENRPSQAQIAVACGISPVTLSRYINGWIERPDLTLVAKLCDYLGIDDMNVIFEFVKDPKEGEEAS